VNREPRVRYNIVAKQEKLGEEMTTEFCLRSTFPPKEVVLRILVAIKNPPTSAGFGPSNLGSSGKQDGRMILNVRKCKDHSPSHDESRLTEV
jgi:hypothetical protein